MDGLKFRMKATFPLILLILISLASCSEYQKLLKSEDYEAKWQKANEFYEQGKYSKVIELMEELKTIYKGTERAEQALYMLGNSYFQNKDYFSASHQYQLYYKTFPNGTFVEDCRFMSGNAAYLNAPDPRLSQEGTIQAMDELGVFLEYYPESDRRPEVEIMLNDLMEKLAYKAFLNCQLYYDLGDYMGNNYESCIVTANLALQDFPTSIYRVDLAFLILKSRFAFAQNSYEYLKAERFRLVVDEYYSFVNEFPESKFQKEADQLFETAKKFIK